MDTRGLLVRLEVVPGKDAEVEAFLQSALPAVRAERGTTAWFAIRFGRSEYTASSTCFPTTPRATRTSAERWRPA